MLTNREGQSLPEYAVIGVLLTLACIAGFMVMGGQFKGYFDDLLVDMNHQKEAALLARKVPAAPDPASAPASADPSPGPAPAAAPSASEAPSSTPPLTFKLSDGSTLELGIPTDLPKSIQTVGANGTTDILATSLEQLAQQLLSENKIDQKGANAILALANQGHKIADIEQAIEQASIANASDVKGFMNTSLTVDGVTYANPQEAAQVIGIVGNTTAQGPELAKFWELYTTVTSVTWNASPQVQAIIDYNTFGIHNVADGLRVSLENMVVYKDGSLPSELSTMSAAEVSHSDSASICGTKGGNNDTGVQCSG